MIQDVDAALEALVRRDALNGSRVEVLFDAPTKDWVARRNAPTVDLYLYDIREELNRREVAWGEVRDETGRVTERRPPSRRFRLSYLVTAWTQRPEDEHRLLSSLLTAFIATEALSPDLFTGPLKDASVPVIVRVALPPSEDRSIADVWTAMGGELKPSLDIQVIAPVEVRRSVAAGAPVLEGPSLRIRGAGGAAGSAGAGPATAAEAAAARAAGRGGRMVGRYGSRPLGPGDTAVQDETVTPEQPGVGAAAAARAAARGTGKDADAGKGSAQDEAAASGGRRIRLRGISRP
jgi:Pvc16 N-terminal domain